MTELKISRQFASPTAIQKAIYRLSPFGEFNVCEAKDSFEIEIIPLKELSAEELKAELNRHINDYNLREVVADQTAVVRGLLYAQAFSKVTKSVVE